MSLYQMQFVEACIQEADRTNKNADLATLIADAMRKNGRDAFKCRADSNLWIMINPNYHPEIQNEAKKDIVIMYTPIRFVDTTKTNSGFYVGMLREGEQTNLDSVPPWLPIDISKINFRHQP